MIYEYIETLMKNPIYAITGYAIGEEEVELLVDMITPSQVGIPRTIDGKTVYIRKKIV